jgi:hypothetical protein
MITTKAFTDVLQGLQQLRPMGKQLDEAALMLAWHTFPDQAKRELTDRDLAWAAGQLLQDPNPPKNDAPHLALLRYVYRVGDGRPRLDWGLRFPSGTPACHEFQPRQASPWELALPDAGSVPQLEPVDHEATSAIRSLVGGLG